MTTVRIPEGTNAAPRIGYTVQANIPEGTASWALRAALDSHKIRNLTPAARETWKTLGVNLPVDVADLTNAIVETLTANATRHGQSSARRAANVAVQAAWRWVQAGGPVPPQPRTYGVGIPATVTVDADGKVTLDLDLSDLGRSRDLDPLGEVEIDDELIDTDANRIDSAVADGSLVITPGIAQAEAL